MLDQILLKKLLLEFRKGLDEIYGSRLKGFYLFGSYARGDQANESDLDLLVILDHFNHYGDEVHRTSQLISDFSLQYDLSISNVFVKESAWKKNQNPFIRNIHREVLAA